MQPKTLHMVVFGLFRDTSQKCKDLFGKRPSAIIVTKPKHTSSSSKLLEGKERSLRKLAIRDMEQRSLGAETRAAILNIGGHQESHLQKGPAGYLAISVLQM